MTQVSPLLGENALPCDVTVGGRALAIDSDFRAGIRFETLVYDSSIPDTMKLPIALRIFFGEIPGGVDLGELIAAMLTFYRCGKPEQHGGGTDRQVMSYTHDYDLIYAAFLQHYGIDLLDANVSLHWWRFRAMLTALPSECRLMQVIGYRAAKITPEMGKEQREHLRRMKRIHALPEDASAAPARIMSDDEELAVLAEIERAKTEGLR